MDGGVAAVHITLLMTVVVCCCQLVDGGVAAVHITLLMTVVVCCCQLVDGGVAAVHITLLMTGCCLLLSVGGRGGCCSTHYTINDWLLFVVVSWWTGGLLQYTLHY